MKTHFYILLMLGMVFLLGCEDEKLGTDLGVTNVVLPDISEESLGTEITIQGNGFIDCDVLALSPLSGGTEQPIYMETREVQSDHITVLYPSTATKDSYGLVLVRGSKMRTLGVINSTVGVMPDENLRNALSALFPDIFKGEKISSSAKYVTFTDGTLNISDKNITSLEGLEYFSNIRKLICNNNDISEIPAEVLSRLSELTAQNTGLTKLELATSEQPNTTLVSLNIDGSTKLESVDLYYCYNIEKFSALNCKLVYLDVRNYHSIYGGCLNYNSTDFKFTFSDDASKERLLKMESWWMDSYYSNSGSIVDAINNGVTVEGYDWMHDYPDGNNNYYSSYGKYQKTMKKYGEIPDINLRNALKALVPDVFDGDKVLTVAALNTEYFRNNTTLDLSNKGITNLEGLQYFCGYKNLILDGNNLGEIDLSKYAISTSYTAGPVDEKGIQTFSAKNAGLTKFISGDQYMITSIDVSNNPGLAYLDINRCKSITSLNASGCPLTYVDLRNLAGTYSVLGYSGGAVDASKVQFSFTDSSSTQRKLLVEEWWMDSPWNGTSPCITAKNQGVRIERYEYIGYDKDKMLSSFN